MLSSGACHVLPWLDDLRGQSESSEFVQEGDKVIVCLLCHISPLPGLSIRYERRIDLPGSQVWI